MRQAKMGFVCLAIALVGCEINLEREGVGDAGKAGDEEFTIAYVGPFNASSVGCCGNFADSDWRCSDVVSGNAATWRGRLNESRLRHPACAATAIGQDCGYVANFSFGVSPYWAVTKDGSGLRAVGSLTITGPLPIAQRVVDNGLGGGNFHLFLP